MQIPTTNLTSTRMIETIAEMRTRITETSQEAVTGRHADLTEHLNGRIGKAMLSEKAVNDISLERERLVMREGRVDFAQQSLSVIQEASIGMDARLQAALGSEDEAALKRVGTDAFVALEKVFTTLNARYGERFLFSGDATATPPFGSIDNLMSDIKQIAVDAATPADFESAVSTYFDDPTGPWQQTIYSGTPTSSDPEAITAIEPAIGQLVSGLATLALARPEENASVIRTDTTSLQLASEKLSTGQAGVTQLRIDRGVIQEQIERQKAELNEEEALLVKTFNDLTARDQFEAATELRQLETNLEASYLLTSRLSNLSLLNFLR